MPVTRHKSLNPALIRFKAGLGKRNEPERQLEPAPEVKEPDELLISIQEAVLKGEVTSEGKPSTRALSERLGRTVSADERDQAFEDYQTRTDFDAEQWC